ncbi:MAG: hypothetical protein AAF329_26120, partial [Cyanobacteria bacterium P01_A01_bin.17]
SGFDRLGQGAKHLQRDLDLGQKRPYILRIWRILNPMFPGLGIGKPNSNSTASVLDVLGF